MSISIGMFDSFGRGFDQFSGGFGKTLEITVRDALGGVVGLGIGTPVSTAWWAKDAVGA